MTGKIGPFEGPITTLCERFVCDEATCALASECNGETLDQYNLRLFLGGKADEGCKTEVIEAQ
ncbi:MAG: hypothetical protein ACR2FG_15380 [Marmoricola sp.]